MGKTVLVVDDEQGIRRMLNINIKLNFKDVNIEEMVNGKEAVQYVAATPPELVLMDIRMPVMDGIAATRQMRAAGYSSPIILNTDNDVLLNELRGNDIGATEVVGKDYLINHGGLKKVLSKYLK